jgi:dUTP pyrophosphatase
MKIKVLEKTEGCFPEIIEKGDWIDLYTAQDITLKCPQACKLHRRKGKNQEVENEERTRDVVFNYTLIPLGICVEVPKGYESIIVPRSSTFKKYGLLQTNSIGVIDQTYCGDEDEWKMPAVATRQITIPKGTRIAQFRIQLSQMATPGQKIKWLFSHKPKFKKVKSLNNKNREGFGSTGEK